MSNLDFLPAQYRQEHVRRRLQPWWCLAVGMFLVLLVVALYAQRNAKIRAAEELSALLSDYQAAVRAREELARLQPRLTAACAHAELLTYLRHPWPRTQLLAALLAPLPEEVTWTQLQIVRRKRPQPQLPEQQLGQPPSTEAQEGTLLPAQEDLNRLREACDRSETVVLLSGTTSDTAALHNYLGQLGRGELFADVELDSIEAVEGGQTELKQFNATLTVSPGYGQPGGPAPSSLARRSSTPRRPTRQNP